METGTDEIHTETITLTVADGTTMPAYVARRPDTGLQPGLLVFQEAFGVNAHIRDVTERFARAGYTAIAPALFHRTDPNFDGSYTDFGAVMPHYQAMTTEGLAADIRAAFDWVTSVGGGNADVAGCVGYCLGGRASFLAAATVDVKAAVSYYGGGIAQGLLDRAPDIKSPILLFWGGLDTHIPTDQVRAVEDALRDAERDYTQVIFSQANHAFFCDARASYEPKAARQSWALTLEFLSTYLK
jgi:carboxymethylenebutenolidase